MNRTENTPIQMSFLPTSEIPPIFRLDAATRQRGRRHVAEIRKMLDERRHAREAEHILGGGSQKPDRAA